MIRPKIFAYVCAALLCIAGLPLAGQEKQGTRERHGPDTADSSAAAPHQRNVTPDETGPIPPADAADVSSLDAIVAAVYDVISGPAGEWDWDRFRSLFVPGARLIPAIPDSGGGASARVLSVEDYVKATGVFFRQSGFFEREVGRRTETFGNIAHVFSTYESRHAAEDPQPFQRGINSMQLLRDGERWWFVTIFWDAERPGNSIPPKYLERSAPSG